VAEQRGYIIFEIANEKRHEIYVGATRDPIFQMEEALRRQRPASIKDWDIDDLKPIRSIEFNVSENDARAFIENYVKTGVPDGWKFLT
jgi:hypothetical protein